MKTRQTVRTALLTLFAAAAVFFPSIPSAEPVRVHFFEGLVHGFLGLETQDGKPLASGDLVQVARGNQVTSRLAYRFRDGSTSEETAVFNQRGSFLLIRDHLVQKGPSFPQPMDVTIDVPGKHVTVRYKDDKGADKVEAEQMDLPPDLANGIIIVLLKNVQKNRPPTSFSYVAATPKPRLVKLKVSVAGTENFGLAGTARRATHYVLKVDIGGIAGAVAPLVGKQPPDSHVWIMEGEAPAFVKSESTLFMGGPVWRTVLVSPVWPRQKQQQQQ